MEFPSSNYIFVRGNRFFNEYKTKTVFKRKVSVCKTIRYYKRLSSTQTVVKKLAEKGFDEGFIAIAEEQTKGYGRIKRKWSSNAGGLWFSMLLKPLIHPNEISTLTLLVGIVLKRVFEKKYKISSQIKWPNDVLVLGKKIAGILLEMSVKQDKINWLVAGIGININNSLPEYLESLSISLKNALNREVKRSEFLYAFFEEFEEVYFDFNANGFRNFLEEYNSNIAYKNKNIIIDDGYSIITGKNLGADEKGRLIIETENALEKVVSGTVRLAENEVLK